MEKSINDLVAVGEFILILKDPAPNMYGTIQLPETAIQRVNTGKILSVGKDVRDMNVRRKMTAVFNKQVGSVIEIFDTELTVLNGNTQVLAVYE